MDTLNREELIRYLRQLSLKYSWKEQFEYSTSAPAELNFDGDCGSQEDYIEENNSIIKHSRSDVKLRRIIINTDSASDEDIQRMRAVTSEVIDSSSGALCSKYQATTQIDGDDEINEYLTNNSFDTEKLVEEPCSSPESTIKIQPKSGRRRIICDSEDEEEEEEEEEQSSGHKKTPNTQLLLTVDLCSPLVPAKKVVKPVLMEARPARRARRVILSDSEEEGEIVQESEGSFLASRTRQGGGVAADSEDEALVDSDCSSTESWIVDEEGSVDSNSSRSDWEEAEEGDGSDDYSSSSCHDQDSDLEEADKENHSSNNSPIHQTAAGKSTSNSSSRGSKSTATPRKGLPFQRSTSPILSKTPSRTERNQQRVEALSTGLKSRRGPAYHHALAQDLFQIYNEVIFDSRLPADLAVTWNKRLLTTAGYCRCKKLACTDGSGSRRRLAAIELSNKVCDSEERMRETLVHEMCHAATWLIDGLDRLDHGPAFRCWGRRATQCFPEIGEVKTTHSYGIHQPHQFQCSNASCGHVYGRHSRKGIDLVRQVCGKCKCSLQYLGVLKKDGSIAQPRGPTAFSGYVKTHFARKKAELLTERIGSSSRDPGNAEVMRALAAEYKQRSSQNSPLRPGSSGADELTAVLVDLTL